MKENTELTSGDIAIDNDMEVDCDIGQVITAYVETWFDVDKKFHIKTADDDDSWLNMYAKYNPFEDTLCVECEISHENGSEYFDYELTKAEEQLIKNAITAKIKEVHGQTPQEFCNSLVGDTPPEERSKENEAESEEVFIYKNTSKLSEKRVIEQIKNIKAYMQANNYVMGGSISISYPMSMTSEYYKEMVGYCQAHGISKIVVEGNRDIAEDENVLRRMLNKLCDQGFIVELAENGIRYVAVDEIKPGTIDNENIGGIQL